MVVGVESALAGGFSSEGVVSGLMLVEPGGDLFGLGDKIGQGGAVELCLNERDMSAGGEPGLNIKTST